MNHYFTDNRHLAQNRKEITFRFSCFTCHFLTDNGVFCKDHVDFGTRTLLDAVHASGLLGEEVLDLGCGSGILSIAALCLGASEAFACDIDDKCVDVAYENAAINGIGKDRYTVRWGDVVTDRALRRELGGPYDVVVANIVADVIKALASTVRPLVREGGIFLCSGIIDDRAEEVAQCLRDNGWTIAETRSSEGWFSYLCR